MENVEVEQRKLPDRFLALQLGPESGTLFGFPMLKRIAITGITLLFVSSIALGQTTSSRPKSQSPTPTPTPSGSRVIAVPRARMNPTPTPSQMSSRHVAGQARPTPTPAQIQTRQMAAQPRSTSTPSPMQLRSTATQSRSMPAPAQTQSRQMATQPRQPAAPTPMPVQIRPTPTPIPPPDVQAYLDRMLANSKDGKFHLTAKGKDIPLTPFHVWRQKSTGVDSTSTCVDMRSESGTVYDIDFLTTGQQVSSIRIHRINGEAVR